MTDSASGATGRIFISYRRQDSAYPAGWLYDRLADRFGPDQVFKDVDSIELGDDFVETITNAVGSCDILLALIGQQWLDITGADGTRRLDDPDDFVRLEIEAALDRKVLLIPILVDGAQMPRGDALPPSIAPMVRRHALELSPNRFRSDTERLLETMDRTLTGLRDARTEPMEAIDETIADPERAPGQAPAPAGAPPPDRVPAPDPGGASSVSKRPLLVAAAAVAAVAVVIAIVLNLSSDDDPEEAAAKPPELGGSGAPVVLAHRGGDEEFAWQTIPAFDHAARIGAQVEMDMRWTKDGVAVLVHDPGTTPGMECGGGNHIIKDTTWPVLRDDCHSAAASSKDGKEYPIPTLDQGVSAVAKIPDAQVYVEVKVAQTNRQVRQLVTALKSVRMTDRTVVTSGKPKELGKISAEAEKDGVDLRLMQFVSGEQVPVANLADDLWGVAVEIGVASAAYVKELKAADLKVMVWNLNTTEQWEKAERAGADIVMTDKPVAFGQWAEGG
jgi:glycerophosphoryl diester phosphodiesterase